MIPLDRLALVTVVGILGVGFLAGIIGGFVLAYNGIGIPGELIATTSAAGGALAGLLVRPPTSTSDNETRRRRDNI